MRFLRRSRRLSPVSVATYLTAVRRLCEHMVVRGTLRTNPARGVTSYQRPRVHTHAPLSSKEVGKLLAAVHGGDELSLRDAVLIRLMLHCALTESEAIRANISDVDWRNGTLAVQGKGRKGKDAAVLLPRTVRLALTRYLSGRAHAAPDAPLVVTAGNSSRGRRMTTRAVRDRVNMYLQECGIRRGSGDSAVAAYSLRLTAALLLRDRGATPEEIRKQLRLGTLTTARLYLNARPLAAGKASPTGIV